MEEMLDVTVICAVIARAEVRAAVVAGEVSFNMRCWRGGVEEVALKRRRWRNKVGEVRPER
jgi:hypothetical protein